MRVTPDEIKKLLPYQIFVYGSNLVGNHKKGAAKDAVGMGAKWGQGVGLAGNTYGIPTKGKRMDVILPISEIKKYVDDFIDFAISMPHLEFLVTEIGCGRAGYKPKDIAPLFERAKDISNIHLPARFWHKLNK